MVIIATLVGLFCGVTAILDMGMNGSDAGWAPFGLGIAGVCALILWLFTP